MKKIYYKDGTYIVVPNKVVWEFESDEDWDRTEDHLDVSWAMIASMNSIFMVGR